MAADVQSWSTNGQTGDEDNLSSCVVDRSSRSENQDPHAKAKAAKKTADTLCNIFEQEGGASGDQAGKTCGHNIGALGSVGHWGMHDELDQYGYCQGEDVGSREEYVKPFSLDAN